MITKKLTDFIAKAFVANDLPAELGRTTVSDRPDLADFQCNGAMQAARIAKKNPREIAGNIIQWLQDNDIDNLFSQIDIAGPGFINVKLSPQALTSFVDQMRNDDKHGVKDADKKEKVIIEFCSPNVAKNMHVGHMRTTFIGDTMCRVYELKGHDVIRMNYIGDWGTPMGIVIEQIRDEHPDLPYFDDKATSYPDTLPFDFDTLVTFYPKGSARNKDDEDFQARVQETTAEFQAGHKGYRALWAAFREETLNDVNKHLDFLNAHHDVLEGESDSHEGLEEVLADLEAKNLLEDSDGAKVIYVAEDDDKHDIPPLLMIKSNGAIGYGSAEIMTVKRRYENYNPDHVIIITDYRQELHFVQVFRAAKKLGYAEGVELEHVGYGTINGKDGKPFKSREGKAAALVDLISMTQEKAEERLKDIDLDKELSQDVFEEIRDQVTVASMRFSDLSNAPRSDYIFDVDQFVAFEGKTGPYLQYSAVRLNTILDKAKEQGFAIQGDLVIDEDMWDVCRHLILYPEAVEGVLSNNAPNILCDFLFVLAQKMNTFYQKVHILSEDDEAKRTSYLTLVSLVRDNLTHGLDLLGIEVPAKM